MASYGTCWSDLPLEIEQMICEKLVRAEDYIRFGAVSSSCRRLVWLGRKKVPPHQPPLLFKSSKMMIPIGSSHGWLIGTGMIDSGHSISLLNPFLSQDNVIKLPSLPIHPVFLDKAVVSHNPTWTLSYTVMVCRMCSRSGFFVLRPGETSWESVKFEAENHNVEDIIYYKEEFYAIGYFGMFACDTSHQAPQFTKVASPPPVRFIQEGSVLCKLYLVESIGELLCVIREGIYEKSNYSYKTVGYRVFKFRAGGKDQWVELKVLSGQAIYLGRRTSLAVPVADYPPWKPNHIYFSDDDKNGFLEWRVFNMEDASFYSLVKLDKRIRHWVQPTINMMDPQTFASRVKIKRKHQKSITESAKNLAAAQKSLSESKKNLSCGAKPIECKAPVSVYVIADFPLQVLHS